MIKQWFHYLAKKCLPEWIQLRLERENSHLVDKVLKLQQEIDRLNAYIDGMEQGMKLRPKIFVQTGGNE